MGILERTQHAVRADLGDLVRKAKNPEAVLEAYLDDLQTVRQEAESLRATEAAECEMHEMRMRDIEAAQATWEKKAKACLKRGDEDLARSALERKLDMKAEHHDVQRELEHRRASLAVLDDSLDSLRLRISEVGRKGRDLRFRRQVLQARSELQRAMGRLDQDRDEHILAEAEDGLSAVESRIEAAETMDSASADRRALKLEAAEHRRRWSREIDDQLAELRRQIDSEGG